MVSSMAMDETCSSAGDEDGCHVLPAIEEVGKKGLSKEVVCELVDYDALPDYLKDNEFVVSYYRSEWPLKQTIFSIFSVHNETVNVWTHLIGFFIFLALTVCTAMVLPRDSSFSPMKYFSGGLMGSGLHKDVSETKLCLPFPAEEDDMGPSFPSNDMLPPLASCYLPQILSSCLPDSTSHDHNHSDECVLQIVKEDAPKMRYPLPEETITRWPFFAFLCGAMFCLLTSSICHLISCHSEWMSYIMLRLDYTGIAVLIVTSFYPVVYYSFLCEPFFCNLYMGFIATFGASIVLVSFVPVFQTAEFRSVRAGLFFCMGVSGLVPIMHKMVAFSHRPEVILSAQYELLMGTFYGLGVVVYATRIPERWMPGKFDLVGHSHQLFHLLVIAGAYTHYLAGLIYLKWRDLEGC